MAAAVDMCAHHCPRELCVECNRLGVTVEALRETVDHAARRRTELILSIYTLKKEQLALGTGSAFDAVNEELIARLERELDYLYK